MATSSTASATQDPATRTDGSSQNGSGAQAGAWLANVPGIDEIRSNPSLTRYKALPDALKGLVELNGKLGKMVPILGPDASDEDRADFYTKLGRPESPDKYDFDIKKLLPEGSTINDDFVNGARAAFHKLGLNNQQATDLVTFFAGAQAAEQDRAATQIDEGIGQLKQEWGHAYDGNVAIAGRAIGALEEDIPGLGAWIESDARIGSNPVLIRLFHFIGQAMADDKVIEGDREHAAAGNEKEIKDQIHAMMNDPKNQWYEALHNKTHPMHAKALEAKSALYDQLYGAEEAK